MWFIVVILMKLYNEKKQTGQRKIFEDKRSTRKWNGAKSYVQGDKQIKKWNKGSPGHLRPRSHPTKFPTWVKELNKRLELGTMGHTLISSPQRQKLVDL